MNNEDWNANRKRGIILIANEQCKKQDGKNTQKMKFYKNKYSSNYLMNNLENKTSFPGHYFFKITTNRVLFSWRL